MNPGQLPPDHSPLSFATLWPFDLESGLRVTCDVVYLYANFGLPRPLCSRLRSDVRDRQTSDRQADVRQHHRLMSPPIRGGGITSCRRAAAKIYPAPLLPLWAPKRIAPLSRPRLTAT